MCIKLVVTHSLKDIKGYVGKPCASLASAKARAEKLVASGLAEEVDIRETTLPYSRGLLAITTRRGGAPVTISP